VITIIRSESYKEKNSSTKTGIKRSAATTTPKPGIVAIIHTTRITRIQGLQNSRSFLPHLLPTML
jgi:hypothetical protein